MHLVAIRRDIYERYPFVATSLYNAFERSQTHRAEKMFQPSRTALHDALLMRDIDEIHEVFGGDPWPYGVEKNRPTLEALVTYLADQHLIAKSRRWTISSFRITAKSIPGFRNPA